MSWTNDKPLNLRQRLAIKLIFLAIKIVEPYEYEHQFRKEWEAIEKVVDGDKQPEAKK